MTSMPKTGPIEPLPLGVRLARERARMKRKVDRRKAKQAAIRKWQEQFANTREMK